MKMDGEQNSENSSAAGGPSQGSEPSVARPLQLEATAPPDVAGEAAEKGALTTRIHDEGQARAVSSQFVESSGEPEKISSTGAIGGDGQATNSSVPATAADLLRDALAALDRRDYATAQRLFETCGRKDAAAAIEGAWAALGRRDYATAQQLFESLSQTSVAGSNVRESGAASLIRQLLRLRHQERYRKWRPTPGLDRIPHHRRSKLFLSSIQQAVSRSVAHKSELLGAKGLFYLDQAC
jgi:hypothetical protein